MSKIDELRELSKRTWDSLEAKRAEATRVAAVARAEAEAKRAEDAYNLVWWTLAETAGKTGEQSALVRKSNSESSFLTPFEVALIARLESDGLRVKTVRRMEEDTFEDDKETTRYCYYLEVSW